MNFYKLELLTYNNLLEQIVDNHNKRILNSTKHINDTAYNTNTKDSKTYNC